MEAAAETHGFLSELLGRGGSGLPGILDLVHFDESRRLRFKPMLASTSSWRGWMSGVGGRV